MLVAAAVCPQPPLLVPQVATGAAAELEDCRSACYRSIQGLLAYDPTLLVVVGGGDETRSHSQGAEGSLHGYGVDVTAVLGAHRGREPDPLPTSLTLGAWLLAQHRWAGPVQAQQVRWDAAPDECAGLGESLAASSARVVMLVLADGSARRGPRSPGYTDERAPVLDEQIIQALRHVDPARLGAIDPEVADAVLCAGRAPLQVLAGAARGGRWQGSVDYVDDPYGVLYVVASWGRADEPVAVRRSTRR